jgi:hypothetical protein
LTRLRKLAGFRDSFSDWVSLIEISVGAASERTLIYSAELLWRGLLWRGLLCCDHTAGVSSVCSAAVGACS